MIEPFLKALAQLALLLTVAPLVSGFIKLLKARLQTRRGPGVLQPYRDLYKLLRKGMVIPDTASWLFSATPYVVFLSTLLAGLMVAIMGDLGMFHTIGIPMPRLLDMLVTGLIIGAGPGPMHSVIGTLQSGKDAVTSLAALAKSKAARDAAQTLLIESSITK